MGVSFSSYSKVGRLALCSRMKLLALLLTVGSVTLHTQAHTLPEGLTSPDTQTLPEAHPLIHHHLLPLPSTVPDHHHLQPGTVPDHHHHPVPPHSHLPTVSFPD